MKGSTDNHVKLVRHGQLLDIYPTVENLYQCFLTYSHEGKSRSGAGFVVEAKPYPLIWPEEDIFETPFLQTFAGHEPRLTRILERRGFDIERIGRWPGTLPEPAWKNLSSHLTGDRSLLRFVQKQDRGAIWYRPAKIKIPWLIKQIALAWPTEQIIVLVTRNEDASSLKRALGRRWGNVSIATTKYYPATTRQVVVCTYTGLKQESVKLRERSICICVNPTEVFQKPDWLPLYSGRLFALLSESTQLAKFQQDHLAALFGNEALFIPRHGFRDLPVNIVRYPFNSHGLNPLPARLVDAKRKLIWRNGQRNRLVAGLATAIAADDDKALASKYHPIAEHLYRLGGKRVVVLVDNLEHAAFLLDRLPGWPVVAGPKTELSSGKLGEDRMTKLRDALAEGQLPSSRFVDSIATMSGLAQLRSIDVVIRADGGVGLPPLLSTACVAGDLVDSKLTIIDFVDCRDEELRKCVSRRYAAYDRRGWSVINLNQIKKKQFFQPQTDGHSDRIRNRSDSYVRIDGHYGNQRSAVAAYHRRHRKRSRNAEAEKSRVTLSQIADHEFLFDCFQQLRREGGQAPGRDGITYGSLSPSEWGEVIRKLSKLVFKSRYRPQATKPVPIPKPGSDEYRMLQLGSICDRILALALHRKLEPHFDKLFLDNVWGFRPKRGPEQLLAHLKKTIERTKRPILALADIRKAFDNVLTDVLIYAHARAQKDFSGGATGAPFKLPNSVLKIVACIARGTAQNRRIGIDQGGNYSPTALNVVLHYVHDLPLAARDHHPCWYRYVDNLIFPCQNESEGEQILKTVGYLLHLGQLKLKDAEMGVFDLRKEDVDLLGFQLRLVKDELVLRLGKETWKGLQMQLSDAYANPNPPQTAQAVVSGWVNVFGIAFENVETSVSKVIKTASHLGFLELDKNKIMETAYQAKERWKRTCLKS